MSVLDLMETRRTYRRFTQEAVPQAVVDAIAAAARRSSCATNRQALRFITVREADKVHAVNDRVKWAGALPPEVGFPKENERPTLFVAVLGNGSPKDEVDAGIAMANMTLAAWEQGVGSCIMGAIDYPALTEMFGLQSPEKLLYMVSFGYPSHKSTLVEHTGSNKYYLDENKDYCVPRLREDELFREF